ncbi:hypothetical protein Asi02nite_13940 [Asanoa siamensis]|uniref:Uncharacterized protein n=1 Tax=Asanoa siamensis TaxID=926357 RepID=A0ABQ4CKR8_9ACTN|nr:hypothetical protein Asi02nite_13940 [Asanoa siamensis]
MTGTSGASKPEHVSARPSWLCAVDGDDWPCPRARTELAQRFDGDEAALAVYLVGQLFVASSDLYGTAKGQPRLLACRFLFWAGGPTVTERILNPPTAAVTFQAVGTTNSPRLETRGGADNAVSHGHSQQLGRT